jgi:hypothetical protein
MGSRQREWCSPFNAARTAIRNVLDNSTIHRVSVSITDGVTASVFASCWRACCSTLHDSPNVKGTLYMSRTTHIVLVVYIEEQRNVDSKPVPGSIVVVWFVILIVTSYVHARYRGTILYTPVYNCTIVDLFPIVD